MRNAASGDTEPDSRNDTHHVVVSNLVSLIEHLEASTKLLELAIAREMADGAQEAGGQEDYDNVIVLDDVTPCYLKANAALNACNAGLAVALDSLLDTNASKDGTGRFTASDRRLAAPAGSA
jgi:hypothetical protein